MNIPARFRASCAFCNGDLDTRADRVYQAASGWLMNRSGGGANAIAMAERFNVWTHSHCLDRRKQGGEQGGLFDRPAPPPQEPLPTNAHFDEAGRFIHDKCISCGKHGAPFGVAAFVRKDQLGQWYCFECRPPSLMSNSL